MKTALNGESMENMSRLGAASSLPTAVLSEAECMTHLQAHAAQLQANAWSNVGMTGMAAHAAVSYPQQTASQSSRAFTGHVEWLSTDDRQAYMEATVEHDIAWQIKVNRNARGWTQAALAEMVGTRQSSIARAEDTTYGRHSLPMLVKIAHAFDCALRVKFIPYSALAEEVLDTSVEALTVTPFSDESYLITQQLSTKL